MPADPKNPGQRTKAHRLRSKLRDGKALDPVDQLWLAEYEEADRNRRSTVNGTTPNIGASRKARTINLAIDEQAESVGTGEAAVTAASAALAAKEEGRRLDALTMHSTDALKEACAVYRDMCLMLKDQVELMMNAVTESMVTSRTHYLARAEMEAAMVMQQQQQAGNPADEMLMAIAAKHFGVDPAVLRGGVAAAQAQQQQKPGPNGVAK